MMVHGELLNFVIQLSSVIVMISNFRYLNIFQRWLIDEMAARHNKKLDPVNWTFVQNNASVPQQDNSIDCGVFAMMYADYIADDLPLDFEQCNIPAFREKIAAALLRKTIK